MPLPITAILTIASNQCDPRLIPVPHRDWLPHVPDRLEAALALVAGGPADVDRYQEAAGRAIDPAVITLYRLRWYLDDLSSAVGMFRCPHQDTADTRQWRQSLAPLVEQLRRWLDLLG